MATKGWLPYGSGHASVVFSDPLTAEITSVPTGWATAQVGYDNGASVTWEALGSQTHTPTHDSTLGMKCVSSTDGTTGCGYRFNTPSGDMAGYFPEGQISFEVESVWLAADDAANGSHGATLTVLQNAIGNSLDQMCIRNTNGTSACEFKSVFHTKGYRNDILTAGNEQAKIFSYGKDRFITVNIGWAGGRCYYAVDGLIVGSGTMVMDTIASLFNPFYMGSDRGVVDRFMESHWMRNVQISNQAPRFDIHPEAPVIGVLSDSVFDDSAYTVARTGDIVAGARIHRAFQKKGFRTNLIISENGGYRVDNTNHPTNPSLQAVYPTGGGDDLTNAKILIIQGGVNDVLAGSVVTARLDAEYKALLELVLGENGNPATQVKRVYVCNIIPLYGTNLDAGYATDVTNKETANTTIAGLPAWWDSTYAARAGAVTVVDVHSALGGESPTESDLYKGEIDGTFTDVHIEANGMALYGDAIADAIMNNLGASPAVK